MSAASYRASASGLTFVQWHGVIAAAGAAPSIHNSQPWRFVVRPDTVELHRDHWRALAVADPTGRQARISCGAALFNLRLAIRALGVEPLVTLLPQRGHPTLLASVRLLAVKAATPQEVALHRAIPRRRSQRRPFYPTPPRPEMLQSLVYAAGSEGGYLRLMQDPPTVRGLAAIVRRADREQTADPAYQAELAAWTGVRHPRPARDYEADPLLAVLLSTGDTPRDQLRAGQALQRALLTATTHGIGAALLSAPAEVPSTRAALQQLLGGAVWPQLVLWLGSAARALPPSRRPVDELIDLD
jgi:nitroreductase